MILIADENVQRTVIEGLRQTGYDVRHIQQMTAGVPDEAVLNMANRESAVLLTYDRDFGELVFRQKRVAKGVILVRPVGIPPARIADLVAAAISTHGAEIERSFTVISSQGMRIRRLPS